ncbi:MAG: hypothetical protein JJE52_13815 [Acidimicrobiia bacterium]|nr:hypothetical protein [Acidimicrobiia bacterium]
MQLAVERLWITAGNVAEEYRRCAELPRSVDPWSQLYARRSKYAHALVGDLSPARVWNETIDELDELIAQIGALCNDPPLG